MTRMDYSNGKIYMLEPTCEYDVGDVYYGSTASTLAKRMYGHRKVSNTCKSKLLFEKYGKENIRILLVKAFPCNNIDELNAEEGKYHRQCKCVNKKIAGQTTKQYREAHKEEYVIRDKLYNETHKDKRQAYRDTNRDKINANARAKYAEKKSKSNV